MGRRARQRDRVRGVVALLLLGVLSVDAAMLPRRGSSVGRTLRGHVRVTVRHPYWWVVHTDGCWIGIQNAADVQHDAGPGGDGPYLVSWRRGQQLDGLWAPVVESKWNELLFYDEGQDQFGREPAAEVRAAAIQYLLANITTAASVGPLATANQRTSRILWGGVVHNLVALLIFAGATWLMPWRRVWRYLDNQPEPVDPDACDQCDYNLAGLDADRCPECGSPVPARGVDKATVPQTDNTAEATK